VHFILNFLSEWREFPSELCLARKKWMTACVSMLLKSRTSPDMLPFSLCNKKTLEHSAYEQSPLSNYIIDSVLRHREVSRAKYLSALPHIYENWSSFCWTLTVTTGMYTVGFAFSLRSCQGCCQVAIRRFESFSLSLNSTRRLKKYTDIWSSTEQTLLAR